MQTELTAEILKTPVGKRANEILRQCVHCGFCTATCPTYQLLGDELDGPRGRIYLVKQMLEGQRADRETLKHLDRCLTCRSCETTCPSGVDYAELIDIGREHIEQQNIRPVEQKLIRQLLGFILPYRQCNQLLFKLASKLRPLLPESLKTLTPIIRDAQHYTGLAPATQKTVLLLEGCVQSTLSPNTNTAAVIVLQAMGYRVVREPGAGCCGAVNHHLNQSPQTKQWIKKNLRQWQKLDKAWRLEAIVSTASGCGVMLKDYPKIMTQLSINTDPYNTLLKKIKDISELLDAKTLKNIKGYTASQQPISFHAPCTLSHGHRLADRLARELTILGYPLNTPANAHLCCGSAGTYSLLQPTISRRLRDDKLEALHECAPEIIITANVGCEHHLNSATDTSVIHWVELVANDL